MQKLKSFDQLSCGLSGNILLVVLMTPASARSLFKSILSLFVFSRRFYFLPFSIGNYLETESVAESALKTFRETTKGSHWSQWIPPYISKKIIAFHYAGCRKFFETHPDSVGLCWNGMDRSRFIFSRAAKDAGRPCLYAELSPLPGYLTIDHAGVNSLNSLPRDADYYLRWLSDQPTRHDWKLKSLEFQRRKPKLVRRQNHSVKLPSGPYIFVPLQVPGDSQLRYFGGWAKEVMSLVVAVIKASEFLPEGWHVFIKEHPSSRIQYDDQIRAHLNSRCYLVNNFDTYDLVENASAVVTVNSSVGLQALFFDKPVFVLGDAFYGFSPLVSPVGSQKALSRSFAEIEHKSTDHILNEAYLRYLVEEYYFPRALDCKLGLNNRQKEHFFKVLGRALST